MDISKNRYNISKLRLMTTLIKTMILWIIKKKKKIHGYSIIKEMEEMDIPTFRASRIYPLLKELMGKGLIKKHKLDRIIEYSITKKGIGLLNYVKEQMRQGKKREFFKEMIGC